jgi:hypothetical protein
VDREFRRGRGKFGSRGWVLLPASIGSALTFAVVAVSASAPAPSFGRSLLVTPDSEDVAIGDLNGDRRADLVTANYNPQSISVYLNTGGGHFRFDREYPVGGLTSSVAIGDLNGDGKADVVAATDNQDGGVPDKVSVFLNKGGGRYAGRRDYQMTRPAALAIADLNGDGKPELAVANATDAVTVLRNRGDGTFELGSTLKAGHRPASIASSDLNGDGRPDLDTANADGGTVSVFINQGDGNFQPRRNYVSGQGPISIANADLNGDRRPDLVTANGAWSVSVLLNRGDGSFRPKRDYRTGNNTFSVAIGDLNGDRALDVAATRNPGRVSVFLNRGDGGLRPKLDYLPARGLYLYGGGSSFAIGDLNGDRRLDLAVPVVNVRNGDSSLSLLINTPGLCNVQNVSGMRLLEAKRTLVRINCRVGRVRYASSRAKKGLVISQKPLFGAVRPNGSKVDLVVSRGP